MYGIDVIPSSATPIHWTHVRDSGRTFAYVRAAYGIKSDTAFPATWRAIHDARIVRGAWQTLRHDEDPVEQAVQFLKLVELQRGDLPPLLDLERMATSSLALVTSMVKAWTSVVESELEARHGTRLRPLIRTSSRACPSGHTTASTLEHHDLCVVDSSHFDPPSVPRCWAPDDWTIHHYAIGIRGIPGIDGSAHLLRFHPCTRGDRGRRVQRIKDLLRAARFGVEDTVEFDEDTARAVLQFQARRGLVEDAIVGPKTFAELHWP